MNLKVVFFTGDKPLKTYRALRGEHRKREQPVKNEGEENENRIGEGEKSVFLSNQEIPMKAQPNVLRGSGKKSRREKDKSLQEETKQELIQRAISNQNPGNRPDRSRKRVLVIQG